MCCFFTTLVLLGPRVAGVVWWLIQPVRWQAAFNNSWLWPVLGLIFLPFTTLMYVAIAPGGIYGLSWIWIGLALVVDIAAYSGGGYGNRRRLGYS